MGQTPIDVALAAAEAQEPTDGLRAVAELRARLDSLEALHVEKAIRAGWSWRRIAESLGVSKQAVHKKHARRLTERLAQVSDDRKRLIVTGQARRSVRHAREEAEALGHEAVGPDDLLLGLLRDESGPAAIALAAAGISLDAARREAASLRPPGRGPARESDGRLPIAPQARAVLEQSLREAVRPDDGHLGVEHLLLALLHAEADERTGVLDRLRVERAELERLLDEAIGRAA